MYKVGVVLVFVAIAGFAACGNTPPNTTLDGGNGDQGMTGTDANSMADLRKPPKGCWTALSNQQSTSGSSKTKLDALLACWRTTCGTGADGGTLPCDIDPDGAACDQCFSNSQVNSEITFTDMNGNPIMCMPANASSCGACDNEVVDCVLDCNADSDCMGLTIGGNPATCQSNTCQ